MPTSLPYERVTNQTTFIQSADRGAGSTPNLSVGRQSVQFQARVLFNRRQRSLAVSPGLVNTIALFCMTHHKETKWPWTSGIYTPPSLTLPSSQSSAVAVSECPKHTPPQLL